MAVAARSQSQHVHGAFWRSVSLPPPTGFFMGIPQHFALGFGGLFPYLDVVIVRLECIK